MDNKKISKKTVADTVCRVHKFGGYINWRSDLWL